MYAQAGMALANLYMSWKQNEDEKEAFELQQALNRGMTAQMLSITYNSILNQSFERGLQAKRMAEQIQMEKREAMGAATARAAHTGARGPRVELQQKMAIEGGAERAMTQLAQDAKNEQDALIDRADMEERAAMNRLFTGTPDLPTGFDWAVEGSMTALSIYKAGLDDQEFESARKRAIIDSGNGTYGR